MVLAAGRGERMRPLTDRTPKPLLPLRGRALIEWHLNALARAGVREVVVNTAWLEGQIVAALGDGARFGLAIRYSMEGRDHGGALETAGGLKKALPLLAQSPDDCFWYVAADVFAPDFAFARDNMVRFRAGSAWGHLWLVPNPPQHPAGDFGLEGGLVTAARPGATWTWSGIALMRAAFVQETMGALEPGTPARLRPFLDAAIAQRRLAGELYAGQWADVGTPQRLRALEGAGDS